MGWSTGFDNPITVFHMSQTISDVAETLSDDLYERTRAQLNTFIDETNALLAAGDALHEDRTGLARERLTEFLKGAAVAAVRVERAPDVPPVTRVLATAKGYVTAHPWAAVGAAASLGLAVSLLVARNRR